MMIKWIKSLWGKEDKWGLVDVAVVLFFFVVMGMMQVRDAEAAPTPTEGWEIRGNLLLRQVSSGYAVRYLDSGLAPTADVALAKPVPKAESTPITIWTTQDVYWFRECLYSSCRYKWSQERVNFQIEVPPPLPVTGCNPLTVIQEALVFDPAFGGFKLQKNPTSEYTGNCTYLKFERTADGFDKWQLYNADKMGADGKPYCPNP